MIAAKGAGLDTCPMEGFDEFRIKRLLNIPQHMRVPIIVPIGFSLEIEEEAVRSIRLPIESKISIDRFGN